MMEGMEEDGDMSPEMAEMMAKGMAGFAGQENMADLGKTGGLEKMMRTMGADAVFDGELEGDSDDDLADDEEAMAAMMARARARARAHPLTALAARRRLARPPHVLTRAPRAARRARAVRRK